MIYITHIRSLSEDGVIFQFNLILSFKLLPSFYSQNKFIKFRECVYEALQTYTKSLYTHAHLKEL
jgi:hypothetical protein